LQVEVGWFFYSQKFHKKGKSVLKDLYMTYRIILVKKGIMCGRLDKVKVLRGIIRYS